MLRNAIIAAAITAAVLAAAFFYPQINEGASNSCGAIQVYGARQLAVAGEISTDDLVETVSELSDGARAHTLIKHRYPYLPPNAGCAIAYYRLAFNLDSPGGSTRSAETVYAGGRYHRGKPASDMTIERNGDAWHITLHGAGPDLGENTPADCHLEAEGTLEDGVIKAKVVPFSAGETEVTAEDVQANAAAVSITLTSSGATVTEAGVYAFCGRHSDLTGDYTSVPGS